MAQVTELVSDPHWFPAALDSKAATMTFARVDRTSLSAEPFLDQRMAGSVTGYETVALDTVIAAVARQPQGSPTFIFHSAFCCSTLLAKSLDQPGTTLSLKEPDVLMGLANALRVDVDLQKSAQRADALVRTVFTLLSRSFSSGESVLVKPTNSANNLLPFAIAAGAPVLLLYGGLRSFLVSVLKKGEACKSFVRQQYNIFALDGEGVAGIPQRQAIGFTDLQIAAMVWRHQMELFQRAIGSSDRKQLTSLDFKALMAEPEAVLVCVAKHLGLTHTAPELAQIAQGPVFSHNSKFSDQAYSPEQREEEAHGIEQRYGETLDVIEAWAAKLSLGTELDRKWPTPS